MFTFTSMEWIKDNQIYESLKIGDHISENSAISLAPKRPRQANRKIFFGPWKGWPQKSKLRDQKDYELKPYSNQKFPAYKSNNHKQRNSKQWVLQESYCWTSTREGDMAHCSICRCKQSTVLTLPMTRFPQRSLYFLWIDIFLKNRVKVVRSWTIGLNQICHQRTFSKRLWRIKRPNLRIMWAPRGYQLVTCTLIL